MSEEEWNYVSGKSKKHRNEVPKAQVNIMEEPINQIKSIYTSKNYISGNDKNKENKATNKPTQEKPKNGHSSIPVKIKQQPKPVPEKSEKKVPPKKPESIETSIKNIKAIDLSNYLKTISLNFPDNDMMLLKAAASFLNEKIPCPKGEFLFADKPLTYPNNIIPNDLKRELVELILQTRDESLQYFLDQSLSSLCENMNKNLDYFGQIILIQLIANKNPQFCINNLARNAMLRTSYQNQSSIGLTLLFALGQGHRDASVALKVWQDLMIPIVDLKSYTAFVYKYVYNVLTSETSSRTFKISMPEFTTFFNTITTTKVKKISKELQRQIDDTLVLLVKRYVESASNSTSLFLFLMKTADTFPKPHLLYSGILDCVAGNIELLKIWKSNYKKYLNLSTEIFKYLYEDKEINEWILTESPEFKEFMKEIGTITPENSVESKRILKELNAKMTKESKKKAKSQKTSTCSSSSSGCCKVFLTLFVVFGALGGFIAYDTQQHNGKFEETHIGQVLKQTGALPHVENAWMVSMKYSARGYKWTEEKAPICYGKTKQILAPYWDFSKDFSTVVLNQLKKGWENTKTFVETKTPVVIDFLDQYIPGIPKKVVDFVVSTFKNVCQFTCNSYKNGVEFFKTKVFVGQLSPENLGKALNSTQQIVSSYCSWFHEKVDFYAKIQ